MCEIALQANLLPNNQQGPYNFVTKIRVNFRRQNKHFSTSKVDTCSIQNDRIPSDYTHLTPRLIEY